MPGSPSIGSSKPVSVGGPALPSGSPQALAVLLPVKTIGVMGDGRTYDFVVSLRAVTSTDGMSADFYPFDMKVLGETATRIINEVEGREPGGV